MKTPLRIRLLRAAACIAPLLACSPGGDDTAAETEASFSSTLGKQYYVHDVEIDCRGMSVRDLSNTAWGETRAPTFGDLTLSEQALIEAYGPNHPVATVPRCGYWFEPTLEAGPVDLLNLDNFTFNTQGTGMLKIAWNGQMWTPHYGDVVLEGTPSNARAEGWYDAVFKGTSGELARIRGEFEWCEPGLRPDCTGGVVDVLPYDFEVELPSGPAGGSGPTFGYGTASDCRVLIDPATTGMRVDMQVAFWQDVAITQLFTQVCTDVPPDVLNFNHLVFETGGVTGPGRYGPVTVHDYGTRSLPSLDFETPHSFLYGGLAVDPFGFCALIGGGFTRGHALTTPDSVCEYEITEGVGGAPGELRLICSNVDHDFGGADANHGGYGDFDLWARCDVEVL